MIPLAPLALCWLAAPVVLLLDARRPSVSWGAAAVLALATAADLALMAQMVWGGREALTVITGGWPAGVGIRLHVDAVALFFAAVSSTVILAGMVHERGRRLRSRSFPGLLLFLAAGLHGAFFTGDLFNFYVFFEVSVVSSFALAAYGYGRQEARGALIYISVNLLGSVIFLTGVAVVYHQAGTIDFAELWRVADGGGRGIPPLGAALLFAALALKLGLFPLHYWVPVLYSHAHPAVAAVMSGALINIGAYGLLRMGLMAASAPRARAADLLLLLGALTVVYGAVLAANRARPREIVAYASIAQAGYVVLALGVGGPVGTAAALLAVLAGALEKAAAFLSLESAGFARRASGLVAAAGIAGLPVTVGFLAKVELFRAVWATAIGPVLLAALIVGTLFLFVATVRFWERLQTLPRNGPPARGAAAALAALTVLLGALAAPLGALTVALGGELLEGGGR